MPQAIADPEDMERFAKDLQMFNQALSNQMSSLYGRFQLLGQTWRDQEHHKFAQEFEQTMAVLRRFVQVSNEHIPFLLRKARRLREYLEQR